MHTGSVLVYTFHVRGTAQRIVPAYAWNFESGASGAAQAWHSGARQQVSLSSPMHLPHAVLHALVLTVLLVWRVQQYTSLRIFAILLLRLH